MNKHLILFYALLSSLGSFTSSFAQKFPDLDKSPHDISYHRGKDKQPLIKAIYGRPQKKERVIFGELEPYGKVWRTGANEATEIKFYKDVTIGNKLVKAGTYSLFTIPDKDKWTVILNSELDQWGAYSYNSEKDVLRTEVPVKASQTPVEAFTIVFKEDKTVSMILAWDKVVIELPITVQP
ncbi:MAG TPA: DUF2911 domain-containing protein [Cytophagaceae bacterium]|jgi:hypothetical protein